MIGLVLIGLVAMAQPLATLDRAERTYDLAAVRTVQRALEVTEPAQRDVEWRTLAMRAHLLAAELLRIEFEARPANATAERRALGKAIDTEARAGLLVLEELPDTSEKFRCKADLIGTMIRSSYRAGNLRADMRAAIDQALALDPENPRALVSAAKLVVFDPNAKADELREAMATLTGVLTRSPDLEQAALMMAHAHQRLGEVAQATQIWRDCLQRNPDCAPARRGLHGAEGSVAL